MTYRTRTDLVCACGHAGAIRTAENDAPFSKEWSARYVDGFNESGGRPSVYTCKNCGESGPLAKFLKKDG